LYPYKKAKLIDYKEEVLGSMKNSDFQPDFEEYTYLYVT